MRNQVAASRLLCNFIDFRDTPKSHNTLYEQMSAYIVKPRTIVTNYNRNVKGVLFLLI